MGLAVGSLVWVQRKNGSWWPGKVVGLDEISRPLKFSSPSAVKTPVRLLGRLNGSVEWYNLETSKRVKAFRSTEFDGFIKNAESLQASLTIKDAKYARREDAVLHALQLEKQEQEKNHITRGSHGNGRQKRSMKLQKKGHLSYSSESSLESKIGSGTGSQNWNLNEQPCMQNSSGIPNTVSNGTSSAMSRKRTRSIQDVLVLDAPRKEERSYRSDTKSTEHLASEVESLFHSTSGGNYLEDSDSICFGSAYDDHQNMMETLLTNVDITIQSNSRKEHVPLVSLMSKLNMKAIIGYPIEVEVLENNPEVFLVRKDSVDHMVDNSYAKAHQLVWRTSKRTPVCYITNPYSSATHEKGEQASKTFGNSNLEAKANNIPQAEKSLLNSPKKDNFSEQNGHNLQITSQSSKKVSLDKQGGSLLQEASCVPVKLIFTKLFFAVGT